MPESKGRRVGNTVAVEISNGYRELAPPPELRHALICLWVRATAEDDATPVRILPDGCIDLIWRSDRGAFVAGPDTRPVVGAAGLGSITVGARFRPGAGGPALDQPLHELRDKRVQLGDLIPKLARRLDPELAPDAALREIVTVAGELAGNRPPDPLVAAASWRLGDPRARSASVAWDLGVSERHLRRLFLDSVGYGPKTLQRVLRFRRFLGRLDAADGDVELAALAAECGFADQAHLTRECARLSGISPAAIARERLGAPA
jgi:AraC-like DNA-binding protein